MSRVDEDGQPGAPAEILEVASDTADECVIWACPLRLPYRRGRQQWLVIRAYTVTSRVTVAVEMR